MERKNNSILFSRLIILSLWLLFFDSIAFSVLRIASLQRDLHRE